MNLISVISVLNNGKEDLGHAQSNETIYSDLYIHIFEGLFVQSAPNTICCIDMDILLNTFIFFYISYSDINTVLIKFIPRTESFLIIFLLYYSENKMNRFFSFFQLEFNL